MTTQTIAAQTAKIGLREMLEVAGVPVLDQAMVEQHMAKELAAALAPNWLGRLLARMNVPAKGFEIFVNVALMMFTYISLAAAIGFLGLALISAGPAIWEALFHDASWSLLQQSAVFAVLAVGSAALGFVSAWLWTESGIIIAVYPAKWEKTSLSARVRTPVAVWARANAARQIGAELFMLELRQGMVMLDPVLYAVDRESGQEFPIAIWKDGEVIA